MLQALEKCVGSWLDDSSRLGDIFLKFAPYFKLYTEYCANYNSFITKVSGVSFVAGFFNYVDTSCVL
jgi:hypothetical protein